MGTLIIAEAGVNHNGKIDLAKKLVDVAKEAGADFVKFQTFKASKLVSKTARKADYQIKNINDGDDSQYQMLKKLELTEEMHDALIKYCKEKEIGFLSTAFDIESADYLKSIGINLFKVPSGEITNYPLLKKIAEIADEVILSTGMCNMSEIEAALKVITNNGIPKNKVTILHCNTDYPTPMKDVNLNAMNSIKEHLGTSVGYSDHTEGIEIPIAAVAMGAECIEKHFTLDKTLPGPDHVASLEPDELIEMVKSIRNIEKALGDGVKKPSPSESKNIAIARKSIHTNDFIKAGDIITSENIVMKRPGNGISPMEYENVLGKRFNKDLEPDQLLTYNDIEE